MFVCGPKFVIVMRSSIIFCPLQPGPVTWWSSLFKWKFTISMVKWPQHENNVKKSSHLSFLGVLSDCEREKNFRTHWNVMPSEEKIWCFYFSFVCCRHQGLTWGACQFHFRFRSLSTCLWLYCCFTCLNYISIFEKFMVNGNWRNLLPERVLQR